MLLELMMSARCNVDLFGLVHFRHKEVVASPFSGC